VAFLIGCKGAKTVGVDVLDDLKTNNSDQTIFVNDKRVAEDVDPYKIKSHSSKKCGRISSSRFRGFYSKILAQSVKR